MKILFSSVGRRVELIQAFRSAGERLKVALTIYGVDISDTAPALFFCDWRNKICRIDNSDYISQLIEICYSEKIDILIPTIDTDLLILSQNKDKFMAIGTRVMISGEEEVKVCRDKQLTADYFIRCGLKSPYPTNDYTKYTGGFPAFIKPKDGSSSINAFKVNNQEELKDYSLRVPNYIIQPFIAGEEYTVDIFCDFNGNPICITPRKRVEVRNGEVVKTQIYQDEKIIDECRKLIAAFKPCGAITVQLIRQYGTEEDYYIEINPRFGGGSPLSMKAGADGAELLLRLLSGEQLDYLPNAAKNGATYSRFDQSVCTSRMAELPKVKEIDALKAVIFDLDDTLYSEKEYVKSGYKAVAKLLDGKIEDAEKKLWTAFEAGQFAIDSILTEAGRMDLKEICLAVYRNHKPNINLYSGVKEMLIDCRKNGLKLGIITDGRLEGQRAKIEALGIEDYVDSIIITDELGGTQFRKPCDIAFQIMQRRLNVPFENMIYIGDNLSKDFIAPQKLGMKVIWFRNKEGLYLNQGDNQSITFPTVKSINELTCIINSNSKCLCKSDLIIDAD